MRHARIRARVRGTASRPRLSVFRSHKHLLLQLINDEASKTILAVKDTDLPKGKLTPSKERTIGVARAHALGALLAERAKKAGISSVVFDRGGYEYHGRVKAVADGARAGGLRF